MSTRNHYSITIKELAEVTGLSLEAAESLASGHHSSVANGKPARIPPSTVKALMTRNGFEYRFKTIAHVNMRGGIGKTTATITLATRAAQYGFKTCIVDMDSQASSTLTFNKIPEDDEPIFYDIWQKPDEMLMGSIKMIDEYLYILPSSLENALMDVSLSNPAAQRNAVKAVCKTLEANAFDLVVIDCPPSLGAAVISTICAAHVIVIPVASDPFSFKGLEMTINEVNSISAVYNMPAPDIKVLYSRYDKREKISDQALERLRSSHGDKLIPHIIRTSTEFNKALEKHQSVFASPQASTAREDYDRYVRYLLGLNPANAC